MANGDAAAAAFGWTPVQSTDDIRLGYDRINQLADYLASQAGFTAWGLPMVVNSPTFTTLTDAAGNSTGTLVGGVRKAGNSLDISFRATYNAAGTLTATTGNIADTTVCTFNTGFRPGASRLLNFGPPGNAGGLARIGSDGILQIVTFDSTASITTGTVLQFDGKVPI